jgi:hypothetical protein
MDCDNKTITTKYYNLYCSKCGKLIGNDTSFKSGSLAHFSNKTKRGSRGAKYGL